MSSASAMRSFIRSRPSRHGKAYGAGLVLVGLGRLVVVERAAQAFLATTSLQLEGVIGEKAARLRNAVGNAVGVEHVDSAASVVSS